jgi:hypothetical protein
MQIKINNPRQHEFLKALAILNDETSTRKVCINTILNVDPSDRSALWEIYNIKKDSGAFDDAIILSVETAHYIMAKEHVTAKECINAILDVDSEHREELWTVYNLKKENGDFTETGCRSEKELQSINFEDFLFGENHLSQEEEFLINYQRDFSEILASEKEYTNKTLPKLQLFHHTMKALRKAAVKTKDYRKFSMIISWVYNNKTKFNAWDLKHIFNHHKELKSSFFPNVPGHLKIVHFWDMTGINNNETKKAA